MDDEILLPDRGEAIAAELLDPFRKSGVVGRKFEVGAVDRHQLRQIVERQHAFDQHDARRDDVDVAGDERAQQFRHAGFDLEPDDRAAPAPLERALVQANEILRLFLDLDVAVANDAKGAFAQHLIARKQQTDESDDQPVQHHEARGAAKRSVGQPDEALDASRNADQRAHRFTVARIQEFERQTQSEIGNERERMRRIDRERRQNRKHVREEIVLQPLPFATGEVGDLEDHDAIGGEL